MARQLPGVSVSDMLATPMSQDAAAGDDRPRATAPEDRLDSWKEIAAYLGRGVRTIQRWEQHEGLPVRRHLHSAKGSVYASRSEIDAWRASRSEVANEANETSDTAEGSAQTVWPSRVLRLRAAIGVLLVLTIGSAAVLANRWRSPRASTGTRAASLPQPRPIATEGGRKGSSALSDDGRAIAYVAAPEGEARGVFVRGLDGHPARRIATTPAGTWDSDVAWAPGGRRVSFNRLAGDGIDVWAAAPYGRGEAQRLTKIYGIGAGWTRDGAALVVSDRPAKGNPLSVFRVSLSDGTRSRLTWPSPGSHGDLFPTQSPDGRWIAFTRWPTIFGADVWVIPAAGGEPRRLTFRDRGIDGIGWMPDSRGLLVACGKLWYAPLEAADSDRARLVGQEDGVKYPSAARRPDGRIAVAYTRSPDDANIFLLDLHAGPGAPAQVAAPSTGYEDHPALSPDGQRLAFSSNRTGDTEIWLSAAGGRTPRQLTFRGGPICMSPRWSPDGRYIAFTSLNGSSLDLYVIPAGGGLADRVTSESSDESYPAWARDGRSLYFRSTRGSTGQIWRQPIAAGGRASQITRSEASQSVESFDGKTLYFVRGWDSPGLWSVPTAGGDEELVVRDVREGYWALCDEGVLFVGAPDRDPYVPQKLFYYRFRERTVSFVRDLPASVSNLRVGFAASRDARFVYFTRRDSVQTDVMLVDDWPFERADR